MAGLTRGDRVRVTIPGPFNPNVPGNREPDSVVDGVFESRIPGIPPSVFVTVDGRRQCHAADNVLAANEAPRPRWTAQEREGRQTAMFDHVLDQLVPAFDRRAPSERNHPPEKG